MVAEEPTSGQSGQAWVTVGSGGGSSTGRFVRLVSPVDGERFTSPARLRFVAAGRDPNVYNNTPGPGKGGNADRVEFLVNGEPLLEVSGTQAEYWVFKGFAGALPAGTHVVTARAHYVNPVLVLESPPVTIEVAEPAYAQTVELAGDLVVGGATYELAGAPGARIRVNGNGFRVVGSGATAVTFRHVDFFDLGSRSNTASPGMDLTSSSAIVLDDCSFEDTNPVRLAFSGAAQASVRRNTFRSNMRQPLGQQPVGDANGSYAAVILQGASTGAKAFSGNNVGAGWVQFQQSANGWLVGGDTDADANVLVGPRVGIFADSSTLGLQIRRNYSHHVYFGGWSQGSNFELGGVASHVAEHNVVYGSSWPVRGVGGEFRYNLVMEAGHQWIWADTSNGSIHHNLFIGGEADVGGLYALYDRTGIRIRNNTFDGMGASTIVAAVKQTAGSINVSSNLFLNVPPTPVSLTGGLMSADYNLFWRVGTPAYSDRRTPAHDVLADPRLASPVTGSDYGVPSRALWQRTTGVSSVLGAYRARYTPLSGSPAIDAGDPALGAGNDIGAVGAGAPDAADRFGTP